MSISYKGHETPEARFLVMNALKRGQVSIEPGAVKFAVVDNAPEDGQDEIIVCDSLDEAQEMARTQVWDYLDEDGYVTSIRSRRIEVAQTSGFAPLPYPRVVSIVEVMN